MGIAKVGARTPIAGSGYKAGRAGASNYVMSSPYESASSAPRTVKWFASGAGPASSISSSLPLLRRRSRQAERNDPHIAKGLHALAINEIGIGIIPRPQTKSDVLKDFLLKKWAAFAKTADPEGVLDIYGMMMQGGYGRRVAGEVFLRRRRRSMADGLPVPLQVQMLESEFLPVGMNRTLKSGNYIVDGIELNKRSMRRAYWMYTSHPGDSSYMGDFGRQVRVPARDVIHNYRPSRIGAKRGVPDASRSLLRAHEYDKYDDAEMLRKQTRAGFTGTIERIPVEDDFKYDPMTGDPLAKADEDGSVSISANTMVALSPGEKANMFDGDSSGAGFADFQWLKKLSIAMGLNVPYELVSGDWSKVNDRMVRAILNEFHRQIEADQDHLSIFQVCRGIWGWFIEALALLPDTPQEYWDNFDDLNNVMWQPQAWRYLNPVQDVQAKAKKIEAKLSSRQIEVAKDGGDVEAVDYHNAQDEARALAERSAAGLDQNIEGAK